MQKRRAKPKRREAESEQSPDLTAFFDQTQEDDLKLWLVRGFTENDWGDITFDVVPTVPAQIQNAFAAASVNGQENLRRAVVRAIGEWTVRSRPSVLADLCAVAAYTKASRVAALLKTILVTKLLERDEDPKIRQLISVAIGTLVGLAPVPDAANAIETLYFDDRVPARYLAQLLHGMVRCDSKNYPRYLGRFTRTAIHQRELYALDVVMDRLIDDVTPEVFAREFHRLDEATINQMIELLPHAQVSYDPTDNLLIFWREPRGAFPVGPIAESITVGAIAGQIRQQQQLHRQATSFAYMLGDIGDIMKPPPRPQPRPQLVH